MATLSIKTLADARKTMAKAGTVDYDKPQINAALQAVEDTLTSNAVKSSLNTAINQATSPKVLTVAQKLDLVKAVVIKLADRWT